MDKQSPPPFPIVFFDGACNLCNGFVDFLIRSDPKRQLHYGSLQGQSASQILGENLTGELSSVVLWEHGQIWRESDAILRTLAHLGGLWKGMLLFRVFPSFLRDPIYRLVARNRYRWFGKRETCRLPSPEERALFME